MAKRFYTVLVLPDASSIPRKFHISKSVLTALTALAGVAIVALVFFLYQYVNLNVRLLELRQLRMDAGDRGVLVDKLAQLEGELSRLRDLDRRVRAVVGLDKADAPAPTASIAQGGAETLSRNALLEALKQRTGRLVDWLSRDLSVLGEEISSRERSLRELKAFIEEKASTLAATPTILPVKGLVTAGYGYRKSPFTSQRELHEGLDIAAPYGSPIVATADGIVTFAGPLAAYGNVVFVDHGHGFSTFYAHCSSYRAREGQRVRRGEVIAYVGTTGRTTGPHVHYEVHVNGVISNPMKYLVDTPGNRMAGEADAEKEGSS
jgi:murein DD-endopeptidase MepM/ murein hydrolase activator NlpD